MIDHRGSSYDFPAMGLRVEICLLLYDQGNFIIGVEARPPGFPSTRSIEFVTEIKKRLPDFLLAFTECNTTDLKEKPPGHTVESRDPGRKRGPRSRVFSRELLHETCEDQVTKR
jgi:hypothetical protein